MQYNMKINFEKTNAIRLKMNQTPNFGFGFQNTSFVANAPSLGFGTSGTNNEKESNISSDFPIPPVMTIKNPVSITDQISSYSFISSVEHGNGSFISGSSTRRPPSGFILFCLENREEMKNDVSSATALKLVNIWKNLSEEDVLFYSVKEQEKILSESS